MLKITIPTPCHEDWEAMTPNQQGRHCTACAKTVIDFTVMSDEEVKYFLLHQQEKTICGRFKQEQLHRITITLPQHILQIHLPLWKQFLTACLLAFSSMLFSCNAVIDNDQTMGEGIPVVVDQNQGSDKVMLGGMLAVIDTTVTPPLPQPNCTSIKGEVEVVEIYTQGLTFVESVPPEQIVEEPIPLIVGIDSLDKKDERISLINDSTKTKNLPAADTTDCNSRRYY